MTIQQLNAQRLTDSIAEHMLVYQRSIGGWPKAINNVVVKYDRHLSSSEKAAVKADSLKDDATIDNRATTREINYLVKAYQQTQNLRYLKAAEKGLNYLFKAQYANGGWPQYYPQHNIYRGQITYNDNAMMNVMNILQDIIEGKNGFEVLDQKFKSQAQLAVSKGIQCILKTQITVNGKLTAWCAQYDERTLQPAKARSFELISTSGMESVAIVEFLMRIQKPSSAVKEAVQSAMLWFESSKIRGYDFVNKVLVKNPNSTIWARFYEIGTNEPFFTGRDGIKKKNITEIEEERRVGYAWYGKWPARLIVKKYPEWLQRNLNYR